MDMKADQDLFGQLFYSSMDLLLDLKPSPLSVHHKHE